MVKVVISTFFKLLTSRLRRIIIKNTSIWPKFNHSQYGFPRLAARVWLKTTDETTRTQRKDRKNEILKELSSMLE